MADTYSSFSPVNIESRPYDAVAGIDSSDRTFMSREAQMRGLLEMYTKNQQDQANLQRYQGETPGILAKSGLEEMMARAKMTDPNYVRSVLSGEIGKSQVEQAAGARAQGTLRTDIAAGNSKNDTQMGADRNARTQQFLQYMDQHKPLLDMSQSPMEQQMIYGRMRQGLPPEMQQMLPPNYNQSVGEGLERLRKSLQDSVEHRQKLEQLAVQGDIHNEGTERVAEIGASSALAVAQERTKAKNKSASDALRDAKTPEQAAAVATYILADADVDPTLKAKAQDVKAKAEAIIRAKIDARAPPRVGPNGSLIYPQSNLDPATQRLPSQQPGGLPAGVERVRD